MSSPNGRFDLDAKRDARRAAQAESAHDRYRFTFGGREFSLAPQSELPADFKRMLAGGDLAEALEGVLDDPEAFWAVRPRPSIQDVTDLFEAYGQWAGVGDLGESLGSPPPVSTPT